MAFRTIEISNPAELHIKNNQLQIAQETGVVYIPLEDIAHIFCIGSNIRLSTMDLSRFSQNGIILTTLDNKYLPTSIVSPYVGNSRHSQLAHIQAEQKKHEKVQLWCDIIKKKIENQSKVLKFLELSGADKVWEYANTVDDSNVDFHESLAAREYFSFMFPHLNRRIESPINSRLNYGYAIVRSAIIRSLVASGFNPTFGIHHDNQLNAFNLADDLIEPFRAMVDIIAYGMDSDNIYLKKSERQELASVLQNACIIKKQKMPIGNAIDIMCESLKQVYLNKGQKNIELPEVIQIERLSMVNE